MSRFPHVIEHQQDGFVSQSGTKSVRAGFGGVVRLSRISQRSAHLGHLRDEIAGLAPDRDPNDAVRKRRLNDVILAKCGGKDALTNSSHAFQCSQRDLPRNVVANDGAV